METVEYNEAHLLKNVASEFYKFVFDQMSQWEGDFEEQLATLQVSKICGCGSDDCHKFSVYQTNPEYRTTNNRPLYKDIADEDDRLHGMMVGIDDDDFICSFEMIGDFEKGYDLRGRMLKAGVPCEPWERTYGNRFSKEEDKS